MFRQFAYEDAILSISAMFPHMDLQVIRDVLEANDGHIENTIDCLLDIDYPEETGLLIIHSHSFNC